MPVIKTVPAAAPGTRRWRQQYDNKLLLVRYGADPAPPERVTTVGRVVDCAPWPLPRHAADKVSFPRASPVQTFYCFGQKWLPHFRRAISERRLALPSPESQNMRA